MNVTPETRRILDALDAEIKNPNTSPERRSDLRDDWFSFANAHVIREMFEDEGPIEESMAGQGLPAVPAEVAAEIHGKGATLPAKPEIALINPSLQ